MRSLVNFIPVGSRGDWVSSLKVTLLYTTFQPLWRSDETWERLPKIFKTQVFVHVFPRTILFIFGNIWQFAGIFSLKPCLTRVIFGDIATIEAFLLQKINVL